MYRWLLPAHFYQNQRDLSQPCNINISQAEGKPWGCLCLSYAIGLQKLSSSFSQYNGLQIGKTHRRTQSRLPALLWRYCKTQGQKDAGGGGQTAENGTTMTKRAPLSETWLVLCETPPHTPHQAGCRPHSETCISSHPLTAPKRSPKETSLLLLTDTAVFTKSMQPQRKYISQNFPAHTTMLNLLCGFFLIPLF